MAHGFTDNAECLIPLAKRLPDKLSPKIYDARAHGLSEAPQEGYSEQDMATDAVELINNMGIENPILYGHSMGANTMAIVASKIDDIRAVVLEDPPGLMNDRTEYEIRIKRKRLEEWRKSLHKDVRSEYSQYPDTMANRIATARKQLRPEVLQIAEHRYSPIRNILDSEANTLILRPDPNKVNRPVKEESLPPNAEERIVDGASHTIFRDKPDKFTNIVSDFIQKSIN